MNEALRKEYLTGRNGFYETDSVKPITTNFDSNLETGRTDKSFMGGMTGEQLVQHTNYSNPNNNLHNNINSNVLYVQNMDTKIFIDSEYRNKVYRDSKNKPFCFVVRFKDSEQTPEPNIVSYEYNGETYSYLDYNINHKNASSTNSGIEIVFPYVFHNVNHVKINTLIMPRDIEYETKSDGSIKSIPGRKLAKTERYLVLKVKQLNTVKKLSNNPKIDNSCFVMKLDRDSGFDNEFYIPIGDKISSYQSQLQTVDRLDIQILDKKGNELYTTLDGKNHNFHIDYQKSIEELKKEIQKPKNKQEQNKIDKLEMRLISLRQITSCIDPELHITINNLNQQINNMPKYRR